MFKMTHKNISSTLEEISEIPGDINVIMKNMNLPITGDMPIFDFLDLEIRLWKRPGEALKNISFYFSEHNETKYLKHNTVKYFSFIRETPSGKQSSIYLLGAESRKNTVSSRILTYCDYLEKMEKAMDHIENGWQLNAGDFKETLKPLLFLGKEGNDVPYISIGAEKIQAEIRKIYQSLDDEPNQHGVASWLKRVFNDYSGIEDKTKAVVPV
jgi:hypothetical protein